MEWFQWVLIALAAIGVGVVLFFRFKGVLTTDKAVIGIDAVIQFVRKAEEIWRDYTQAGAQKKAWVLAQLKELSANVDAETLSSIIDNIVDYLNDTDWAK